MAAEATVRISIADVPRVRDAIEQATQTISTLQDALIAKHLGRTVGPGLMGIDTPTFAALWERAREELRAEGLPMGAST